MYFYFCEGILPYFVVHTALFCSDKVELLKITKHSVAQIWLYDMGVSYVFKISSISHLWQCGDVGDVYVTRPNLMTKLESNDGVVLSIEESN